MFDQKYVSNMIPFFQHIRYNINNNYLKKVFILGNVSCDLDSFLSSLLMGIAKNFSFKSRENRQLYIPLLNCKRGELQYRFDIDYLTKLFNINQNKLFYINDSYIKEQLANKKNKVILVDHNRLDVTQRNLINESQILSIYDHHKDEGLKIKTKHILYPLGSCSTLILNKFYLNNPFLFNYINPLLSISAILLDTENFDKKLYGKKWTNLDKFVIKEILYENPRYNMDFKFINSFYKNLVNEKFDKNKNFQIGINGILKKDLKNFQWSSGIKCLWSTLQVTFKDIEDYFGKGLFLEKIKERCKIKKADLYIANYSSYYNNNKVKIFIIYNHKMDKNKFNKFIDKLYKDLGNRCISKINLNNNSNCIQFIVEPSISRKHFEPYIRAIL